MKGVSPNIRHRTEKMQVAGRSGDFSPFGPFTLLGPWIRPDGEALVNDPFTLIPEHGLEMVSSTSSTARAGSSRSGRAHTAQP
jgi:hypothetical protein